MTIFMTEIDARLTNSDSEDDPVHEYCSTCYPGDIEPDWSLCGVYLGDDSEYRGSVADDEWCVLCELTDTCPKCKTYLGHP